MWQCSSSEDRKAAVSCFRCWGPWELLSWRAAATGSAGFMWLGEIACRPRVQRSQPGRQAGRPGGARAEVSGSAAEMVPIPSATHPPSWQVVGGWSGGKQPGFLSIWLQKPGIRFQARLSGGEIKAEVSPPVLWAGVPCLARPAVGVHGSLRGSPWDPRGQGLLGSGSFPPSSEPSGLETGSQSYKQWSSFRRLPPELLASSAPCSSHDPATWGRAGAGDRGPGQERGEIPAGQVLPALHG